VCARRPITADRRRRCARAQLVDAALEAAIRPPDVLPGRDQIGDAADAGQAANRTLGLAPLVRPLHFAPQRHATVPHLGVQRVGDRRGRARTRDLQGDLAIRDRVGAGQQR
jgi:hypothetical protein